MQHEGYRTVAPKGERKAYLQPSRSEKVGVMSWITPELRKALKQVALDHDVTLQELTEIAFEEVVENGAKYAKRIKAKREEQG